MRDPNEIRESCARKIAEVQMVVSPDGHLLGRAEGQATEQVYLGTQDDLTRNIHGLAAVANLDGDEVGYLVGAVAAIKRKR
jgi:hypothetical protein